jgi:hypothetical protein
MIFCRRFLPGWFLATSTNTMILASVSEGVLWLLSGDGFAVLYTTIDAQMKSSWARTWYGRTKVQQ